MMYLTLAIVLIILLMGAYLYIKRTKHGYVDFNTGMLIKFMPDLGAMPPVKLRHSLEAYVSKNKHKVNVPVSRVEEVEIPTRHGQIRGRLYQNGTRSADRMIIFFHGGGWCIGSIDTHDEQVRRMAVATGLPILSVNYSLSPEAKFPVAFEECIDVITWARNHQPELGTMASSFVTMGDSAGANLAISTAKHFNNENKKIINTVIAIYPVTDMRAGQYPSRKLFESGFYLTQRAMDNFKECYLSDSSQANDPRVSVIIDDDWKDFPKTFVLTTSLDPLRDEGIAFVQKLRSQGCDVQHHHVEGAIHGFFGVKAFGPKGLQAIEATATYITSN